MILGINASRGRSGGARAHLVGILGEGDPASHGISRVHVWSYRALLDALPDRAWLSCHGPEALSGSLQRQVRWERFELPSQLRATGCDVLLNIDAGTVCRFAPAVTMSRDMLSYEPGEMQRYPAGKAWARLLALRYLQNRSLRSAQAVIFLSRHAAAMIQRSCGTISHWALIPHGVGEAFRNAPPPRPWPAPGTRPVRCVYVSPLWRFKHQWIVVQAVEQLRSKGHDLTLTIAGDGDDDAKALLAAQVARSDPGGRFVTRLGHVPHDRLPGLLADTDLFVFASSCENMPNTVLEAMAVGLPIACSDRGPMPEVLGDGGVYFDPENAASIATAIESLVVDPDLRERVARRAKERAAGYSWARCARETFDYVVRTHQRWLGTP